MAIKVLIAERHEILRHTLCQLLAGHPQIEVVATATTEREALALATRHQPDVVLVDGDSLGLNSFQASLSLKDALPHTKVVLVAEEDSEDYRRAAAGSGASACVPRSRLNKDLPGVIASILR